MSRKGWLAPGLIQALIAVEGILFAIVVTVVVGFIPAAIVKPNEPFWIAGLVLLIVAAPVLAWLSARPAGPEPERVPAVSDRVPVVVGAIPREPSAFVDRATIGRLAEAARSGRPAVVCAVTGLRGVGKTQVAAAYARSRIADGWGLVGWVNAESRDVLLTGLARVADATGVADPDGDSEESAHRLREHLMTRTGAGLLVVDNATDPDGLRPFLPAAGGTQVVVTSTDRAFATMGVPVDVSVFTRPESVGYLAERTGLDDGAGADAVAAELGDLPLGLAQAADTIKRRHLTYPKYLEQLSRVPIEILLGRMPGDDYPRSAAAALLLSVQAAEDTDPSGMTNLVLRVMAALSPDGVRLEILEGLAPGDGGGVDDAVDRCARGSLLTWSVTKKVVIMHRLLGRVLRQRDQAAGYWTATVTAALGLLEPLLFPEEQAWSRRAEGAQLAVQVEALWHATAAAGTADLAMAERLLRARSWAVRQLRAAADLSRAIDVGAGTLADSVRFLGEDHPDTLTSRNNLAYAYETAGRLGEAIPLYEQNLADFLRVLGEDHPDTLTSRNNLAGAYESAGRLAKAIPLYEQNLEDRVRLLGEDHPDTLMSRNNLAYAYQSAERLDEAIPLYERNLEDRVRLLGEDHPRALTSRNNLAYAYQSAERLDEAIRLYERNLAGSVRALGEDHPDTLTWRHNLAGAYQSAGRLGEAIALYERNLEDRARLLGKHHPDTLTSRNNLAGAYQSAGRLAGDPAGV